MVNNRICADGVSASISLYLINSDLFFFFYNVCLNGFNTEIQLLFSKSWSTMEESKNFPPEFPHIRQPGAVPWESKGSYMQMFDLSVWT